MKKLVLITMCYFTIVLVNAQTEVELPNVIPPSLNAQTFLKYGEFPVSNYTGVPYITIPIYTIKLKDISVPISISYNASGIRVDEEASRVGLGWVLNAGGLITHTIMGRHNDFEGDAYFNENLFSDITNIYPSPMGFQQYTVGAYNSDFPLSNLNKTDFYKSLVAETSDCEVAYDLAPDVFNYNFMGYSGKFIFSHSGKIIKEKEDNLKIEITEIYPAVIAFDDARKKTIKSWKITAPDGTKYEFNQTEQCWLPPFTSYFSHNSSFYLTKIETINGIEINFSYKKQNIGIYNRLGGISQQDNINGNRSGNIVDTIINFAQYDIVYLDKITYPNGQINFNYQFDREDLQKEARLDNITINNMGSNIVKWNFEYSYFTTNKITDNVVTFNEITKALFYNNEYYNDNWKNKRLKLNGLYCDNKNEHYGFLYEETELPSKLSTAQDHWGYYNGSNNQYLIPHFKQNISQVSGVIDVKSSGLYQNREPSEQHNQAFILRKITYPTGGKTEFIYETNKYKADNFENDPYKKDFMYLSDGNGNNNGALIKTTPPLQNAGNDWNTSENFYISGANFRETKEIHIYFRIWINKNRYNDMQDYTNRILHLSILDNNNNTVWYYDYDVYQIPSHLSENYFAEKSWTKTLGVGNYKLKAAGSLIYCIDSLHFFNSFDTYPEEYITTHPVGIGGGLRIKEIKSYNNNGYFAFGKRYRYTNDDSTSETQTSGKLMFYPRYRKAYNIVSSEGLRGGGYSVGYSKVFVSDIDNNGHILGKTEYEYINKPDKNLYYCENGILYKHGDGNAIPYPTWDDETIWDGYSSPTTTWGIEVKSKDINPYGVGAYRYTENGTIIKEIIYKNYEKQVETTYNYLMLGGHYNIVWGLIKSGIVPYQNGLCWGNSSFINWVDPNIAVLQTYIYGENIALGYFYPALQPYNIILNRKTTKKRENEQEIETIEEYSYNDKNLLTQSSVTTSNSATQTTKFLYPFDLTSNSAANVYNKMTAKNILAPYVKKYTYLEPQNKVISGESRTFAEYSAGNSKFYKPQSISYILQDGANITDFDSYWKQKMSFSYNDYGKVLTTIDSKSGFSTIYLWGYNNQYPIIKIENATLQQIKKLGVDEKYWKSAVKSFSISDFLRYSGLIYAKTDVLNKIYTELAALLKVPENSPVDALVKFDGCTEIKTEEEFNKMHEDFVLLSAASAGADGKSDSIYLSINDLVVIGRQVSFTSAALLDRKLLDFEQLTSGTAAETAEIKALGETLRGALTEAWVWTYTYKPLVGITSIIDPHGVSTYFEYDSFGRLKNTKDSDLKLLQEYQYNYQQIANQ
jgi:YD repeat-containing protein